MHKCNRDQCGICDGGLSVCLVCKGAEATLPSECPGRALTEEEEAQIGAGLLDYVGGKWKRKE